MLFEGGIYVGEVVLLRGVSGGGHAGELVLGDLVVPSSRDSSLARAISRAEFCWRGNAAGCILGIGGSRELALMRLRREAWLANEAGGSRGVGVQESCGRCACGGYAVEWLRRTGRFDLVVCVPVLLLPLSRPNLMALRPERHACHLRCDIVWICLGLALEISLGRLRRGATGR